MRLLAAWIILSFSFSALAVTVDFPQEELATESVLPLFDNPEAVKSRLVPTAGRWELGLDGGFAMNEPFFQTMRYGGHFGYHFTETHGLMFVAHLYQQGLNNNGNAFIDFDNTDLFNVRLDFAPQNQYHFFLNYQITPYYGKISVTKGFTMNLSLYGFAGIGAVGIGSAQTENSIGANLGVGQKFYISKNFGIRTDLGFVIYQAPNYVQTNTPLLENLDGPGNAGGQPTNIINSEIPASEFEKILNFDMQLSISMIWMI